MQGNEVFNSLADPTRRELIEALAERGGATATELAADMPITRQAVAKHLMHLHRRGLVAPQRQGRETLYHLTTEPLGDAIEWLESVCSVAEGERAA